MIALALLIMSAEALWLLQPSRHIVEVGFDLEITGQSIEEPPGSPDAGLPIFDSDRGGWKWDGHPIPSVARFVADDDPEHIGPDGIGKSIAVKLEKQAGAKALQKLFLALASEGICQVAVLQPGMTESPVYRIVQVKNQDGVFEKCRDRFNHR
jgi:hypothetical protein